MDVLQRVTAEDEAERPVDEAGVEERLDEIDRPGHRLPLLVAERVIDADAPGAGGRHEACEQVAAPAADLEDLGSRR